MSGIVCPTPSGTKQYERKLGKKKCKLITDVFLLLVFIGCAIFSVYQSSKSIIRYYENPILTSVTERDLQESDMPYVVLCSRPILEKMTLENLTGGSYAKYFFSYIDVEKIETYPFDTISLDEYQKLLNNFTIYYELRLPNDVPSMSYEATTKWIYSASAGMCFYFRPWKQDHNNGFVSIHVVGSKAYEMKLVQNPADLHMFYSPEKMRDSFVGIFDNITALKVDIKQTTRVPTKKFVCSKDNHQTRAECLDTCIAGELLKENVIDCKLPWMKPRLNIPTCNNFDKFKKLVMMMINNEFMRKYKLYCIQKCPESCVNTIYTIEETFPKDSSFPENILMLSTRSTLKIVNEFRAYELMNVVGDVGGIVGIFLGFSVFGISEMVVNYVKEKIGYN